MTENFNQQEAEGSHAAESALTRLIDQTWPRLRKDMPQAEMTPVVLSDLTAYIHDEEAPNDAKILSPQRRAEIKELIDTHPNWLTAYIRERGAISEAVQATLSRIPAMEVSEEEMRVRSLVTQVLEKNRLSSDASSSRVE
jgi:hypothetical protein